MISVNLLDWRSKRTRILNHRFIVVAVIAAIVSALLTLSIELIISSKLNTVKGNVAYLDSELQSVEGRIKEINQLQQQKDLLLSRRKVIESLQASRPMVVSIFDNIVRAMPDGVYLKDMTRKENVLTLSGVSNTNYAITVLMDNVQKLNWVKDAKLGEIKTVGNDNIMNAGDTNISATQIDFQLVINIKPQTSGTEAKPNAPA